MEVTYKIYHSTLKRKKEKYLEIESTEAIKLFNEFHWEQIQNEISKNIRDGLLIEDNDSIIFRKENGYILTIFSFDKDIYVSELSKEKQSLTKRFPEIINGSPKLRKEEVKQIINSFFAGNFEAINEIFERTRTDSSFEIGPNAKTIKQQADRFIEDIESIQKQKNKDNILKLNTISYTLIGFGLFIAYIVIFRIKGNDVAFKTAMSLVCILIICGGIYTLVKNRRINN